MLFRYGKGFGIIQHVLGKDHYLNLPNSVFGIIFFLIQMTGNAVLFTCVRESMFNKKIMATRFVIILQSFW